MTSLNPVFTIGNQVAEPLKIHQKLKGPALLEKVKEMFIKAQEAICEAAQKQYPGKIPKKDKYSLPQTTAFKQFSKPVSSDIDDDLRKMLRKGPIH